MVVAVFHLETFRFKKHLLVPEWFLNQFLLYTRKVGWYLSPGWLFRHFTEKPMISKRKKERIGKASLSILYIIWIASVRKWFSRNPIPKTFISFWEDGKRKKKAEFFIYSGESDDLTGFLEILGFEVYNGFATKLVWIKGYCLWNGFTLLWETFKCPIFFKNICSAPLEFHLAVPYFLKSNFDFLEKRNLVNT